MIRHRVRTLAAAAVLALSAPGFAQWDSTPYELGGALELEGFLVAHEAQTGVRAFSALAAQWVTISPPGSTIRGTGDWLVLVEEPTGYRAWSARLGDSELLTNVQVSSLWVHDDVAVVVDVTDQFAPIVWAYSAQWNTWESLPVTAEPVGDDVAISRFVVGLRDEADYWGFAARTGKWSVFHAQGVGGQPQADGHTLVVDQASDFNPSLPLRVAAFSGVTGTWAESPDYPVGAGFVYDHGVAAVPAFVPGGISASAWSAYFGTWVTSQVVHASGLVALETGDNWVRAEASGPGVRFEAFGSSPGQAWAGLTGSYASLPGDADDVCLVEASDGSEVVAFSGLAGGKWEPLATPGAHSVPSGPHSLAVVRHGGTAVSAFSPGTGTWATVDPGFLVYPETGDSVAAFYVGTTVPYTGFAARGGTWAAGPLDTAFSSQSVAQGAVFASQAQSGPDKHRVTVFDELWGAFEQTNPGFPAQFLAGDNLLLVLPTGTPAPEHAVHAWSAARGDWTSPPAALPLSTTEPPAADEMTALLVDANGELWAFGAPNQGHIWYSWPHDSEWHVTSGPIGVVPRVVYAVRAEPGQLVAGLVSPAKAKTDGAVFGLGGTLWLPLSPLLELGLLGVAGSDRTVTQRFPLSNPLQQGVEVYWQPLVIDLPSTSAFFADRLDASWFF